MAGGDSACKVAKWLCCRRLPAPRAIPWRSGKTASATHPCRVGFSPPRSPNRLSRTATFLGTGRHTSPKRKRGRHEVFPRLRFGLVCPSFACFVRQDPSAARISISRAALCLSIQRGANALAASRYAAWWRTISRSSCGTSPTSS